MKHFALFFVVSLIAAIAYLLVVKDAEVARNYGWIVGIAYLLSVIIDKLDRAYDPLNRKWRQ